MGGPPGSRASWGPEEATTRPGGLTSAGAVPGATSGPAVHRACAFGAVEGLTLDTSTLLYTAVFIDNCGCVLKRRGKGQIGKVWG